jgi:hypothetical protein
VKLIQRRIPIRTCSEGAMRMRRVCALLCVLFSSPAWAAEPVAITASAGQFNVRNQDPLCETGWEVRFAPHHFRWLPHWAPDPMPTVGGMATSRGALYVYGGFHFDMPLGEGWRVSPQWASGLYYHGDGRDLGGILEFRSGIELSRQVGKGRVGLLLYHLSNAGFYSRNPGTESLVLTYTARP